MNLIKQEVINMVENIFRRYNNGINLKTCGMKLFTSLKILNIDGQIATIDTIKSLKNLRANLNTELKEYETQRTSIKKTNFISL